MRDGLGLATGKHIGFYLTGFMVEAALPPDALVFDALQSLKGVVVEDSEPSGQTCSAPVFIPSPDISIPWPLSLRP